MSEIYCPRCDKRITPDHRCLSRRHFFGMLAGAAALLVAPKPALPSYDINATAGTRLTLRAGDRLSVSINGMPATPSFWTLSVVPSAGGEEVTYCGEYAQCTGPLFLAAKEYIVTDARVVTGGYVHRVPIEINRSGE